MKQKAKSIPDKKGNYDLDGISYSPDSGVIAGSAKFSNRKVKPKPKRKPKSKAKSNSKNPNLN